VNDNPFPVIRRILVALDASSHSRAALRAAVELAAALDAELVGLFVEEIELVHLCELPVTYEVGLYTHRPRPLSREYMERQLRALARQAEAMLAEVAERQGVRWSFRTVRGTVSAEVLNMSAESDVISLGVVGHHALMRAHRLGSTVQVAIRRASRPLLIARQGVRIGSPVLVLSCDSPYAERALALAARFRERVGGPLVVLVLAPDARKRANLRARAERWLADHGVPAHIRELARGDAETIARAVEAERGGLLVVPGDTNCLPQETLEALLQRLKCPVLWLGTTM